MKKIRKRLPTVLLILLAVLFIPGIANAKTKEYQGNLWNFKKTIQKTSGAFTYYAYPSKNQKEAWIYKIDLKSGKNCSKLSIPSKLDNKKVTRLGRSRALVENDAYTIFGQRVCPSDYEYDKADAKVKRIRKLVLPDTVKIIQPASFCCMVSIKTVKIPKSVKKLDRYTFYHCDNLKRAELSAGLNQLDVTSFMNCPKIADIKISSKNKTYQVKDRCLITKKKKELVFALADGETLQIPKGVKVLKKYAFIDCTAKTVHIPASVKKIEGKAFSDYYDFGNNRIENVTVDEKNSVYARDGQCIYNKLDKSLAVAIWDENGSLFISDKVELLTEDKSSITPGRNEGYNEAAKLVYPPNLKRIVDNGFFPDTAAGNTYFTGEEPPEIVMEKSEELDIPPSTGNIYVPEASKAAYQKWYKNYMNKLPRFKTFKPGDEI